LHLARIVFDLHPFLVARGFFELCFGPVLRGRGERGAKKQGGQQK
jgi:hypothetical protein